MSNFQSDDKFKLYVSNLSRFFSPELIKTNLELWFSELGTIVDIYVPKAKPMDDSYANDRYSRSDSNQSRGFAFVTMSNQAECDAIIEKFNGTVQAIVDPEDMNMVDKYPREVRIVMARPQEPRNNISNFSRGDNNKGYAKSGCNNYNNDEAEY
jgi:RNA recognition motif-containing protein